MVPACAVGFPPLRPLITSAGHGFAVDWNAARPELVSAGWEAHPCCAELHFVRAPDGAEQAAERERGGPV